VCSSDLIFTAVQPWNVGAAIIAGAASTISLRVFAYEQRIVLPEMKRFQKTLAPQPHLDPGDAHMILTAFGPDRVGLVAALARGVSQSRANISASKIITIGDDIAFMMVVSSSKERAPALRAALSKVGEEVGLQLHVSDVRLSARADESSGTDDATEQSVGGAEVSATSSSGSGEFRARLSLVGPDSPGLVHRVATLLSTHSPNITSMDTRVHSAPAASTTVAAPHGDSDAARSPSQRSATDVFDMTAVVSLSGAPDVAQIDASLAKLANELGVKITLQWITGESRNNSIV
jgi:glycine cleavage system regulatory protein